VSDNSLFIRCAKITQIVKHHTLSKFVSKKVYSYIISEKPKNLNFDF